MRPRSIGGLFSGHSCRRFNLWVLACAVQSLTGLLLPPVRRRGGVGKTLPDRVAIGGGDQMARVGVAVGKKISPDVNCAAGATAPARPWPDVSGPCHHPQGPSDARQNAWPHQHGSPWHTCAIQKGACHLAGTAALGASRLTGRGCSVRSASGQNLGFHRPV